MHKMIINKSIWHVFKNITKIFNNSKQVKNNILCYVLYVKHFRINLKKA